MSQVIDTLYEPLLTSSGDLVVSADSSQTATYDAVGVTSQSNYVFELWSPGGQQIADLSPYLRTRHFTVTRNRPEIVDLSFDLGQMESVAASLGTTVRNLFGPGFNEIRIKRGQRYLVGSQVQFFYPSLTGDQRTLQIRAVGFLELLKDRYLYPMDGASLTQTNQDIGQIMWNFINLTQSRTNGSFGFTLGVIQPSRTITDTWQPHATNIRDILIALTKRYDSVDLSFTPDKIFNVSYPMGQDKTELRFSLPGNIKDLR